MLEKTQTLSAIPQDLSATFGLSESSARAETLVARKIVEEALEVGGYDPAISARILIKANPRFSRRMGDARCTSRALAFMLGEEALPGGILRFSSHALWRRATPEKRRNTIIHELAHIIAEHEQPGTKHGHHWKVTMRRLGEVPKRCHTVNRDGIARKQKRRSPAVVIVDRSASVQTFRVGSQVRFTYKGQTIRAEVVKRNRKTVEIREVGGFRSWRVSPGILALAS
jgi:hypothetical protein